MQGKMAIIGDGDSVTAFKAGGVDAYAAENAEKAKELLRKLAKNYAVIFIAEEFAENLGELNKRMLESAYPIVVPVPGKNGSNGYAREVMKERMERALGVDILFGREER